MIGVRMSGASERVILYRPVGLIEMRLIYESGLRVFPPRLPTQPIFYPVLNREYARQIARDWNTKANSFAGYVTGFELDDAYAARFEVQTVGSRVHKELWVPAEELAELNRHIRGSITVLDAYFGPQFRGYIPDRSGMRGRDAIEQLLLLVALLRDSPASFHLEIRGNHIAVFLHYPFWHEHDASTRGVGDEEKARVLAAIRGAWAENFPDIPLPAVVNGEGRL